MGRVELYTGRWDWEVWEVWGSAVPAREVT